MTQKCLQTLTSAEGMIASPNYPNYYGQDKYCNWHILPPENSGKSVEINFKVFDLAPKSLKSGKCQDTLLVNYGNKTVNITSNKLFPKKIISEGSVTLQLQTCYRHSLSRFQGFNATYKFVTCPGCGVGDSSCPQVHTCQSSCGRIVSINYPLNYNNNHRCRWLITAPPEHYLNLTIDDFDVPSAVGVTQQRTVSCMFDHVTFIDGTNGSLIGRYCNSNKPPKYILSSWNQLLIEFNTDSELAGRGFSFTYRSFKFRLPKELELLLESPSNACPKDWSYYNEHCYRAVFDKALQWYEAESRCAEMGKGRDGHLVSILDEHEMSVVHHLLINVWKSPPYQAFYIGLFDVTKEGLYRWSDNNPMSYTDWAPLGNLHSSSGEAQPDGGAYEDCTIL
ncbi:relaxin receptor-like protein, partial [Leptotrombidium deliense]